MQLFASATRGLSGELSKNEGMGGLGAKYRTETRDVETLLAAPSKHLWGAGSGEARKTLTETAEKEEERLLWRRKSFSRGPPGSASRTTGDWRGFGGVSHVQLAASPLFESRTCTANGTKQKPLSH